MVSKKLTVVNSQGFHMRPAMTFASEMGKYPCKILIKSGDKSTDGKSLMNIIAAGIKCGSEIEIICDGDKEKEALDAASSMIENGFGE